MRKTYVNRNSAVSALLCVAVLLSACGGGGGGNSARPGSVQFNASSISINENGGTATLTITRTGGTVGAVSVALASSNGSATAGQDYTSLNTSVSFAAGDAAAKTVTVAIADDGDAETDETLSLTLSAPTGGASVGSNGTVTLTILDNDPPAPPVLTITSDIKQLIFEWASVPGASRYRLLRDPDGASGFTEVGADYPASATQAALDIAVHRHDWVNALYRLEACNADRCSASAAISAIDAMVQAIGYFKASNTGAADFFGSSLALSADGRTLAVGASSEDSNATGADGDQSNDGAEDSGAVYVFTREAAGWSQQAYLKASNTERFDSFGGSLALSADGRTLAVGATHEDSNATVVDGDGSNNDALDSGAVYVFTREGAQWSQQAYVKAFNTGSGDLFGNSIALSADGDTLAVGAVQEDSATTGVGGDGSNNGASSSGAAYVFTRENAQWSQQAYVKASNTQAFDQFGYSLTLSPDGDTLAVGAFGEDSNAIRVGGDESNNGAEDSGAVYVFTRDAAQWSQRAYVKAFNAERSDQFGSSLALSADGHTLAVGAPGEDSAATGVDGDPSSDGADASGAAYVFTRDGAQWSPQTYVKAFNTQRDDGFGGAVALSADGYTLAVGARAEDSNAAGVNRDDGNNSAVGSGAVYTFTRAGASWHPQTYVKASNTDEFDFFGYAVALSAEGDILAVSAATEGSGATGVGGDQTDNNASGAGAVYLY